jgi:hypothetical protein
MAENDPIIARPRGGGAGASPYEGWWVDALIGSVEAKSISELFVKRQPSASHAFVKLKLGNVITLDGHDPSGGGL